MLKISTEAKLGQEHICLLDSYMNFTIDKHNFRIHNAKEYIPRSFPELFGQTKEHKHLSRFASKEKSMSAHRNLYRMLSIVTILFSIPKPIKNPVSGAH